MMLRMKSRLRNQFLLHEICATILVFVAARFAVAGMVARATRPTGGVPLFFGAVAPNDFGRASLQSRPDAGRAALAGTRFFDCGVGATAIDRERDESEREWR